VPARVAVRVNPDFELKSSGMKMGGGPKQFGVDAEQVPELLAEIGAGLAFEGFPPLCRLAEPEARAIVEAQQKSYELALRLAAVTPRRRCVSSTSAAASASPTSRANSARPGADRRQPGANRQRAKRDLPQAELVIELGRYLVGEAGLYVARIVDRKVSRGQTYLVTDGGLHHHLSASGNFGQVIRKNYPVAIGNRMPW
jgi:diaminopimelate decarboxylase